MKRIYRWYKRWSLATRQFLFLFIVTFAFFILLAWNNYYKAADLFKNQMVSDSVTLIARTNQFLDTYLDNSRNVLLLLSTDANLLREGDSRHISESLRFIVENNSALVETLYFVRKDGQVFASSQLNYDIIGNPQLDSIVGMSLKSYGAVVVSQPYVSPLSGQTVSISRPVTDDNGDSIGVAVIELNLENLNRKISEYTSSSYQTFVIMSDTDSVVAFDRDNGILPQKPGTYHEDLPEAFVGNLAKLPVTASEMSGPTGKLVVVKSGQNRLGWTLLVLIKDRYFYQNVIRLFDNYKAAASIWFVVLLFMAFAMSRYMTKSVRMLAIKMDRVHDMGVIPSLVVKRDDEIGRLSQSFNAMMERIRNLLQETKQMEERKKLLELKVLQSQIAPHFLYNTLACIGSLAKQHRTQEVKETIRALVGVLSLSFDKTSEFITVKEELEGLNMYMQIQKIRYGDKFSFVQEIDPEALSCTILKLTLQPILENAVFHGVVPSHFGNGLISVRGSVRNGKLRFFIRDNGAGMEKSKLRKALDEQMEEPSRERSSGIGMANVHHRLRLHYGAAYGLRIGSVPNAGTVVCITLPALQQ
ncbi:sensor histidine kinase [Paenibacillus sp. CF384]|uniref:cache domain-containing sensor histidine kinase n=1 Tax=Paenibacillus sp. CF384 TaxID=1884382 RepID=UPI000899FE83|nr:sensor histidine kinase [Paenibacillus sp. CF384]SDW06384.1 Histidine kinase-, DNA gyrase B-, and HSP90-like ATPase [Paenibacillus sp. CF384]